MTRARTIVAPVLGSLLVVVLGIGAWSLAARLGRSPVASSAPTPASTGTAEPASSTSRQAPKAALYCEFYDMMRARTVVGFDFQVEAAGTTQPRYTQVSVVASDVDVASDTGRPGAAWSFLIDDGTPAIRSHDGTTLIELYGLKPHDAGIFWIEAGIRSVDYKNLEGRCRQAHYESLG